MEDDDTYFDDVDERDQHLYQRTTSTEPLHEGDKEDPRTAAHVAGDDSGDEIDASPSGCIGAKSNNVCVSEPGGCTVDSGKDGIMSAASPTKDHEKGGSARRHRSKSPSARGGSDTASRTTRANHRTERSRSRSPHALRDYSRLGDYSRLTYEEYLERADKLVRARGPPLPFRPHLEYQDLALYPPGPPMMGFPGPRPGVRRRRY